MEQNCCPTTVLVAHFCKSNKKFDIAGEFDPLEVEDLAKGCQGYGVVVFELDRQRVVAVSVSLTLQETSWFKHSTEYRTRKSQHIGRHPEAC